MYLLLFNFDEEKHCGICSYDYVDNNLPNKISKMTVEIFTVSQFWGFKGKVADS